jgi:uncharacterized protein (TIGR03437 family)
MKNRITRRAALRGIALAAAGAQSGRAACLATGPCTATAANGEPIPNWTAAAYAGTVTASDGGTLQLPAGMIFVPAGSFVMGTSRAAGYRANADGSLSAATLDSRHTVALSDYFVSKCLITNAQYRAFCDEMGSSYRPGGPNTGSRCYWDNPQFDWNQKANHPVLWVSYNNAAAYCVWVAKKTGWKVMLPSEAQWERAARGKTSDGSEYLYGWGNSTGPNDYRDRLSFNGLVALKTGTSKTVNGTAYPYWPYVVTTSNTGVNVTNFKSIAHNEDDAGTKDIVESSAEAQVPWTAVMNAGGYTTEVGTYPAGPGGCYDMSGNAFEFTRDYYTLSSYVSLAAAGPDPCVEDASVLTDGDKKGGSDGTFSNPAGQPTKIVRGGSWYANEVSCTTHMRTEARAPGNAGFHSVGFRIVVSPPAPAPKILPSINTGGVVNGASGAPGVAPGAWISIFGANFAAAARTAGSGDLVNGSLPSSLGGVSVRINNKPAFLYYVSPAQLNLQAPDDTAAGPVSVTVTTEAGTSAAFTVQMVQVQPAFFAASGYAVAVKPGVGVAATVRPGDVLELYGTGFGATRPAVAAGTVFSAAYPIGVPLAVTIGGLPAEVLWCGLVGAGLFQVNVTVPAGLANGDQPVVAAIGSASSPAGVRLMVSNT